MSPKLQLQIALAAASLQSLRQLGDVRNLYSRVWQDVQGVFAAMPASIALPLDAEDALYLQSIKPTPPVDAVKAFFDKRQAQAHGLREPSPGEFIYLVTEAEPGKSADQSDDDNMDDILFSGAPYGSLEQAKGSCDEPTLLWTEEALTIGHGKIIRVWRAESSDYRYVIREYPAP